MTFDVLNPLLHLHDRARGCIIGGTLGNAMGGPFEGQPGPIRFEQHAQWSISDDSQLTLATCESIIEAGMVSGTCRATVRSLVSSSRVLRRLQQSSVLRDTSSTQYRWHFLPLA